MNADISPTPQRARILIADDCSTSRLMQETILRRTGHQILTVPDGEQLLEMAMSEPPDLIVLDLNMPRLNGIEALKALKRSAATRHVPIIVVTISRDAGAYVEAAESGCSAFLTKPFDSDCLLTSVERNLAAARRLRLSETGIASLSGGS